MAMANSSEMQAFIHGDVVHDIDFEINLFNAKCCAPSSEKFKKAILLNGKEWHFAVLSP